LLLPLPLLLLLLPLLLLLQAQHKVPDPSHCSTAYPPGYTPSSSSGRMLFSSTVASLNGTGGDSSRLAALLSASGEAAAARRLLDDIQPSGYAYDQVQSLKDKLSGVYNVYQAVHSVVYPIYQSVKDAMSTMGSVIDQIDDFLAPFTPFEGIINSVANILSYVQ
jgi:hypothetical protein